MYMAHFCGIAFVM